MNLFAEGDHAHLVGPAGSFDREELIAEHGEWGHQLLRAATAMEMLAQITSRGAEVLLKGGTLLQHALSWPPYRASVDLDLEVKDADELQAVLSEIKDAFEASALGLAIDNELPLPGFIAYVRFPRAKGPDWTLRIDVLENARWPALSGPWTELPAPWKTAQPPIAADPEVRAAQKLLMAAEPIYGRDLGSHLGRQNFVKDLFDLRCLGHEPLDGRTVLAAAKEDVERKSGYLGERYGFEDILGEARATFKGFAPPPVDDDTLRGSLWRAYDRIKGGIRIPFTRADLRTTAGCAHHCIQALEHEALDWPDAWRPSVDKEPRKAWVGRTIQPVVEVEDGYGTVKGPLEAWARFEP